MSVCVCLCVYWVVDACVFRTCSQRCLLRYKPMAAKCMGHQQLIETTLLTAVGKGFGH